MAFFESNERTIEIFGSDKLLEDLAKQYDSKIIAKIPIKSQICYDDVDLEVFVNICKAIE